MTKKRLIKQKDEYQEVHDRIEELMKYKTFANISLQERNLIEIQIDAMETVLDCIAARLMLVRGHESGKHD